MSPFTWTRLYIWIEESGILLGIYNYLSVRGVARVGDLVEGKLYLAHKKWQNQTPTRFMSPKI